MHHTSIENIDITWKSPMWCGTHQEVCGLRSKTQNCQKKGQKSYFYLAVLRLWRYFKIKNFPVKAVTSKSYLSFIEEDQTAKEGLVLELEIFEVRYATHP